LCWCTRTPMWKMLFAATLQPNSQKTKNHDRPRTTRFLSKWRALRGWREVCDTSKLQSSDEWLDDCFWWCLWPETRFRRSLFEGRQSPIFPSPFQCLLTKSWTDDLLTDHDNARSTSTARGPPCTVVQYYYLKYVVTREAEEICGTDIINRTWCWYPTGVSLCWKDRCQ
jgi:hypothetical protein